MRVLLRPPVRVDDEDASESTSLLRGESDRTVAWRRRGRATVVGVLALALACCGAFGTVSRWDTVADGDDDGFWARLGGRRKSRFTVQFQVDVGCIPLETVALSPVKDFYANDIAGVRLLRRGRDPRREFGGVTRRAAKVDLVQSGWSTIYVGRARMREGEEFGFGLVNALGEVVFELGRNKLFPNTGELANATCLKHISAGGGTYRNRVVPRKEDMRIVDGVHRFETTWAGCLERCPLTVKLVACTGPATGDADNVWGIEESKAMTDYWRNYKGHYTSVSSGEFNTWGLNTETGALAWTRNADLNQFSRANWISATNNPVAGNGVAQGSMVDFDAGYDALIGVTQSVETAGGYMWRRPVDGSGDWQPADSGGGRGIQVTIGRTHHFHMNGYNNMWSATLPNGAWVHEAVSTVKQVEVGDSDVYVIYLDGTTLKRKAADTSGSWSTISIPSALSTAKMSQITVGATALWILDNSGSLWGCDLPCTGGDNIRRAAQAPANIISIDAGKVIHNVPN